MITNKEILEAIQSASAWEVVRDLEPSLAEDNTTSALVQEIQNRMSELVRHLHSDYHVSISTDTYLVGDTIWYRGRVTLDRDGVRKKWGVRCTDLGYLKEFLAELADGLPDEEPGAYFLVDEMGQYKVVGQQG